MQGISCTTVQIEWLGFITIPLMALAAFALVKNGKDAELAESLRAEIRDPKLVQRLEGGQ